MQQTPRPFCGSAAVVTLPRFFSEHAQTNAGSVIVSPVSSFVMVVTGGCPGYLLAANSVVRTRFVRRTSLKNASAALFIRIVLFPYCIEVSKNIHPRRRAVR